MLAVVEALQHLPYFGVGLVLSPPSPTPQPSTTYIDILRYVLQLAGVAIGVGSGQLVIFLLKRRQELRSLDTKSDSTALDSANAYIVTLQSGDKAVRTELDALKAEMKAMQRSWDIERQSNSEALANSGREVSRLTAELGRVKSDLAVAQSQIEQLGDRMPGRHMG